MNRHPPILTRVRGAGFGLVELILVLALILAVVLAVFVMFGMTQEKTRVNLEVQRLLGIMTSVRQVFGGRPTYVGLTTGLANEARVFPVAMNGGDYGQGAPILNVWNGSVSVDPSADPTRYLLRYEDVPSEACVALVPETTLRATTVRIGSGWVHESGEALDMDEVVSACAEFETVAVEWVVR